MNVVGNVLQPGIVAQDQREVPEGILHLAVLVDVQSILPVRVFFWSLFRSGRGIRIQIAEFLHRLCPALLRQLPPGSLILRGIFLHQLHGVSFIANQRSVRSCAARREQMPAHQVKGVAQLAARRIGSMVGIGVFIVIDHQTACRAAADIGIPIALHAGMIHVLQKRIQHVGDCVRPAEGTDDAALLRGILLLPGSVPDTLLHRLRRRPEGGIPPVGIGIQHLIRVEKQRVAVLEHEFPILRRAGPVHQAGRLKGRGIKAGEVQIVRHAPGDSGVFIRRDRAHQRNDQAQAHPLRGMAVRAVQRIGVDERHVQIVHQARIRIVCVQAQHAPVHHAGVVAPSVLQVSADETAHILHGIAISLGHGCIVRHTFSGTGRGRELVQKFAPHHLFVLPLGRFSAPANGDQELAVVLHLHEFFLLR